MKRISVIVVDDSAFIRVLFQNLLKSESDIEVVATAVDPFDAREKIKQYNPDVITLDIEMPKMDGLAFLEKIMTLRPMPVVMASTLTQKGASETIRALELGAVDYISKPSNGSVTTHIQLLKEELATKIRAAAQVRFKGIRLPPTATTQAITFEPAAGARNPVIAIGSSTGGVEALCSVFRQLPRNSPPIIVTQHILEAFAKPFASRLDQLSDIRVSTARAGDILKSGHAYVAPGNAHLKVLRKGANLICQLEDSALVSGHRPSVDAMFQSVARHAGPGAVGVILTGMGKDGAEGLLAMRKAGAHTVGQNEASCIVYGMPKAAALLGAVESVVALKEIPRHILGFCEHGAGSPDV